MANETLQRTPTSTGNSKVFTWSGWVKRNKFTANYAGSQNLFRASGGSGGDCGWRFDYTTPADSLRVHLNGSAAGNVQADGKSRDPGTWMHVMVAFNSTLEQDSARVRIYVNGALTPDNNTGYPAKDFQTSWNETVAQYIGSFGGSTEFFNGGMFDVYMVDGQALTPDVFGFYKDGNGYISAGSTQSTDFRPGQWVPKKPSVIKNTINNNGGFGVNGFYLPINDSSNFGADFHCDPNTIITLQDETAAQPKNGAPTTTDAYVNELRSDPYAANLVLAVPGITGGQGSGYGDYSADIKGSGSNKTVTANGNAGVAVTASYYGSAMTFDGSDDYFTLPANTSDLLLGSSDFTIECWVNRTNSGQQDVCGLFQTANNRRSYLLLTTDTQVVFYLNETGSSGINATATVSVPLNQWTHLAAERYGSNLTVYINGVAGAANTEANFTAYNNTVDQFMIGASDYSIANGSEFTGYIQDFRFYKGVAKYKGGFDVSKPYTPVGIGTWRAVPDCTANNFAILNPLAGNGTLTDGNLTVTAGGIQSRNSTFATPGNGKWYAEFRTGNVQSGTWEVLGIHPINKSGGPDRAYAANGQFWNGSAWGDFGTAWSDGDIIGVAYDQDNNQISFYLNGTLQGSTQSYSSSESHYFVARGNTGSIFNCNFGQNPTFSGTTTAGTNADDNGKGLFKYAPPSGFLALCEDNLPSPAIADPGDYFKTVLYTGSGSARAVTGVGFKPDLVWIKKRSTAGDHKLIDSVRGAGLILESNTSDIEGDETGNFSGFSNDGFDLSATTAGAWNESTNSYVAWCWKIGAGTTSTNTDGTIDSVVSVNQDAGVSIVTYTSTGSNTATETVGHGLNNTPNMIILKNRSASVNWRVYHSGINDAGKNSVTLNSGEAAYVFWPSVGSDTFGLANSTTTGQAAGSGNEDVVAYCWTEIEGFSKFGSYTGNGDADGPFVYCGFKPAWVLIKSVAASRNWRINDSSRSSNNPAEYELYVNLSSQEANFVNQDFLSNGFKLRTDNVQYNESGVTYIFAAFAESPFKTANAK